MKRKGYAFVALVKTSLIADTSDAEEFSGWRRGRLKIP
jgi:hypothetical protein